MSNSNVVNFATAKPKTITKTYKKHEIVIKYVPSEQMFEWKFKHEMSMTLSGYVKDADNALLIAKREVDRLVDAGV